MDILTPKEKAKELFDKYVELSGIFIGDYESEKEMCLIVIEEVLKSTNDFKIKEYWEKVKIEIIKIT
jgi:hypothetical protein